MTLWKIIRLTILESRDTILEDSTLNLPIEQSQIQTKTPDSINQEIERQIEANVGFFKQQGEAAIKERLIQLDREWTADQTTALLNATTILATVGLAFVGNKKWLYPSMIGTAYIVHKAIYGWSPPHAVARKLRVRTSNEIALEKTALTNLLKQPL